jgi:hypothetical protein
MSGQDPTDACDQSGSFLGALQNPVVSATTPEFRIYSQTSSYSLVPGNSNWDEKHLNIGGKVFFQNLGVSNLLSGWAHYQFSWTDITGTVVMIQPTELSTCDSEGDGCATSLAQGRQLCLDIKNGFTGNDVKWVRQSFTPTSLLPTSHVVTLLARSTNAITQRARAL